MHLCEIGCDSLIGSVFFIILAEATEPKTTQPSGVNV